MAAYRVIAGRVEVTTRVAGGGRATVDRYAGDSLPADVPAEQVNALLTTGRIEAVIDDGGDTEAREVDSTPELLHPGPAPVTSNGGEPVTQVDNSDLDATGGEQQQPGAEPTNQQYREWARSVGLEVSDSGKVPAKIVDAYRAARQQEG
jgi:hypothetical protein